MKGSLILFFSGCFALNIFGYVIDKSETKPSQECPTNATNPTFLPNPADCSKYFECANGTKTEKQCAPGLSFNPQLDSCQTSSDCRAHNSTEPNANATLPSVNVTSPILSIKINDWHKVADSNATVKTTISPRRTWDEAGKVPAVPQSRSTENADGAKWGRQLTSTTRRYIPRSGADVLTTPSTLQAKDDNEFADNTVEPTIKSEDNDTIAVTRSENFEAKN